MLSGNRRRASPAKEADEVPEFWVVYSDLLASLLVVFVLLLFMSLSSIQRQRAEERARRQDVAGIMTATGNAIGAAFRALGATGVSYDSTSRTLIVADEVLFAFGSATLRPEARALIHRIATKFADTLLADTATSNRVAAIVVEGHTDTVGTYLSNLELSQKRAQSVMKMIVEESAGRPSATRLRELLVASGRSEVEAIKPGMPYEPAKARRIAIRVQLRNDDLLRMLLNPSRFDPAGR